MDGNLFCGTRQIPERAGLALKPEHHATILAERPDLGFFEIHAEHYMAPDGPPDRSLAAIRAAYPLSVHGLDLSIGGGEALDKTHLARLRDLITRYEPGFFSEHLAWSPHGAAFGAKAMPVPYTTATLTRVMDHVDQVQRALGCRMLLENPATCPDLAESTYAEVDFIAEVVRRTGCGLLLDVNNAEGSASAQGYDAFDYIARYPLTHVEEVHLEGLAPEQDAGVWQLFGHAVAVMGPKPTLIDWDGAALAWDALHAGARRTEALMALYAQVPLVIK